MMKDLLDKLTQDKPEGILGLPRLFSFGPFTVSAEPGSYEDIEQKIIETAEANDIDLKNPSSEELDQILIGTIGRVYPENTQAAEGRRRQMLGCVTDNLSGDWAREFTNVTTGKQNIYEDLVLRIKFCKGLIEQ